MATISFSTVFRLDLSTPRFNFEDTSDYTGQGITWADISGSFQITAPSGNVIYDNLVNYASQADADICYNVSGDWANQTTIQLPNPLETGTYSILYKVWNDGNSTTSTVTETFDFDYVSPVVSISGSVQVYTPSPLLTEYDNTVYIVNSVTPTLSRVATITYPPIMVNNVQTTPTSTVGTTAVTTSTTFYSPTQVTMSVVSNLTYVFTGAGGNTGFTVIDKVSGLIPFDIDATSYCKLFCGLQTNANYIIANPQDTQAQETFALMMAYVTMIQLAQNCGKTDNISVWIAQIEALGHFTEECSCGEGVQQVIGLGALVNAYNVLGANSYITVTPVTSGNTTTFTIALNPTFVATQVENSADIATLQGQVLTLQNNSITLSSTDGSVTITNSGSNPTNKDLKVKRWFSMAFTGTDQDFTSLVPYLECVATVAYPSTPNASFIFEGTTLGGIISRIKANFYSGTGTSCSIKIDDLTNSTTICELTGVTTTTSTNIVDLGTISNLPASPAKFGIYVKTNSATKANIAKLGSLMIGQY